MTDSPNKPAVGSAPADKIGAMNLWQKLAAITGEIGSIAKDGQNSEQKYKFIEYSAVAGALRTLFGKYHVVCNPHMGKREAVEFKTSRGSVGLATTIEFQFVFKNADKPEETETIEWVGEAADYGDKGTNKAATAALKYCLMRTFNVSEKGDEDPDSATIDRGEVQEAPAPKRLTIQDAIARASAEITRKGFDDPAERKTVLLKIAGIDSMQDLTGELMNHVFDVLDSLTGKELRGYLEAEKTEEVAS